MCRQAKKSSIVFLSLSLLTQAIKFGLFGYFWLVSTAPFHGGLMTLSTAVSDPGGRRYRCLLKVTSLFLPVRITVFRNNRPLQLSLVINQSPVSVTLAKIVHRCRHHRKKLNFIAGVDVTSDIFSPVLLSPAITENPWQGWIAGVVDTGEQLIAGVLLTPVTNDHLRLSLQIWNSPNGILRGPVGHGFMKKTWSQKSHGRLPVKQ